jgi:glycerol uptake facilitator-like aquaporin
MNAAYWLDYNDGLLYKIWAEFIGCMMFHFIGSVSPTPWANGISLMVLVYFIAKISGAHLNPSVSTVFMLLGYINPLEMIAYWFAQVCGCAAGALWIWALVPNLFLMTYIADSDALAHSGCFVPKQGISDIQIYGWETLCTFCFIAPIFAVVWYTSHKSGYGNTGPIMVGLSLMANAFVAGQYTGAALNPARAVGSPIVFNCPANNKLGYYILGEMTAAVLAPIILIPWYGIANKCWYVKYFPIFVKKFIKLHQPSVRISTTDNSPRNTYYDNRNSIEIVESNS